MKKILPIIAIVAILGIGGYFLLNKPKSDQPQTPTQQVSDTSDWTSAVASGQPTTCTMIKGGDKMEYLIKGKKMKATITTSLEGVKNTSNIISDEKFFYMWSEGQLEGTKMPIPSEADAKKYSEQLPATPDFGSKAGVDSLKDQGYTLSCQSTSADDSQFVPPTTVKFIDTSSLMNALPAEDPNGRVDMSEIEKIKEQFGGEVPANY